MGCRGRPAASRALACAPVPLDLTVPPTCSSIKGKRPLDLAPGSQPGCVLGRGDELGAGQVEVALAWALGGQAQASAELKLGLEEVGLEPVDGGVREGVVAQFLGGRPSTVLRDRTRAAMGTAATPPPRSRRTREDNEFSRSFSDAPTCTYQ